MMPLKTSQVIDNNEDLLMHTMLWMGLTWRIFYRVEFKNWLKILCI